MPGLHLAAASIFLLAGELFSGIAPDLLLGKAEKKAREDAGLAFV